MEKRRPVSEDVPPVHHTMHLARELAMQVLFVWDTNAADDDELAEHVVRDRVVDEPVRRSARSMARAAWEMRQSADEWIERLAPQWPPRRQPVVDRNILRLAVWELTSRPTPPKVVIDEAIELAKQYSTEQSAAFVNGVLDAVLKQHKALAGSVRAVTPTDAVAAAGPALRSPDQSAAGVANPDPPGAPHPDSNLES